MARNVPQTFANHARFVPLYHFVASVILLANVVWTFIQAVNALSFGSVMAFLVAVALVIVWLYARVFALTAQDRIIRLEMQLRMQRLLPADLQARIGEFRPRQLVALRFASDAELPALAKKVLDEGITDRTEIKKLVKEWQADYLRV